MKNTFVAMLLIVLPVFLMGSFLNANPAILKSPLPNINNIDRNWRMTEIVTQDNTGTSWENTIKYTYYYNQDYPNRADSIQIMVWQNGVNAWANQGSILYTFDATQEYITQVMYWVYPEGFPVPFMRGMFTYDDEHRLTLMRYEWYNAYDQIWNTSFWTMISYSGSSGFTVFEYDAGGQGQLQTWKRKTLEYDTQGRIILETNEASNDSISWVNFDKTSRQYHPDDTTTTADFIANLAHMISLQSDFSLYPDDLMFGHMLESHTQVWDNSAWVNSTEKYITYAAGSFQIINWYTRNWSTELNDWQLTDTSGYSYDNNGNLSTKLNRTWSGTEWLDQTRQLCTWENPVPNQDESAPAVPLLQILAAPNPFHSDLKITIRSKSIQPVNIRIFNCRGQLIRNLATTAHNVISWNGLDNSRQAVPSGIYFIRAETGNTNYTVKVLKLK